MSWGTVSLGPLSTMPGHCGWMWGKDPWVSLPTVVSQCPHPFFSTPVLHLAGSEGGGEVGGYTEPRSETGTVGGCGPGCTPCCPAAGCSTASETPLLPTALPGWR